MFFQTHKGSLQVFRYCSIFKVLCASAFRLTTWLFYHRSGFLSSFIFSKLLNVLNLDALKFLGADRNFSASIGSFQRLRAEASEVILLSQRLTLKYNTTPRSPCQHFSASFFCLFCKPFRRAEIDTIWMPSASRWASSEAASFIFAACPERSFHPLGRDDRQPLRAGTRFSYLM